MSLQLASKDNDLQSLISRIEQDGLVTPAEFSGIRERADSEAEKITDSSFRESLEDFLDSADEIAEALKQLALDAREAKLGVPDKDAQRNAEKEQIKQALKRAVEFQLAYTVMTYKASLERL